MTFEKCPRLSRSSRALCRCSRSAEAISPALPRRETRDKLFPAVRAARDATGRCWAKRVWFLFPLPFTFHELFELGANNLGPALLEILARERRGLREGLQPFVGQFQARLLAVGK